MTTMVWTIAVRYVDPILLLIACGTVLPLAFGLVREGVRELFEASPAESLQTSIRDAVAAGGREVASTDKALPVAVVRATKLGRRLYLDADFVVAPACWTVDEEDKLREAVQRHLDSLGLEVWARVQMTTSEPPE